MSWAMTNKLVQVAYNNRLEGLVRLEVKSQLDLSLLEEDRRDQIATAIRTGIFTGSDGKYAWVYRHLCEAAGLCYALQGSAEGFYPTGCENDATAFAEAAKAAYLLSARLDRKNPVGARVTGGVQLSKYPTVIVYKPDSRRWKSITRQYERYQPERPRRAIDAAVALLMEGRCISMDMRYVHPSHQPIRTEYL